VRELKHIWFIFSGIFGVLFIIWGSITPCLQNFPGDIWLIVPGILMVLFSLLGFLQKITFERQLLLALENTSSAMTLRSLAATTGLQQSTVRKLFYSLRESGKLRAFINVKTGEIVTDLSEKGSFCPVCSEPITKSIHFCSVCGTEQSSNKPVKINPKTKE
jgi:hypothetical protein